MAITYKDIRLVTFPVYALPSGNWYGQDGLLFLDDKILDDKNMKGVNLGMRRLQTPHKNLYPTLATNDERILEQEFKKMITDDKYRFDIISSAWQKVNDLHSFKTCKEQISELYLGNM